MTGGRRSRAKGSRTELAIVRILQDRGLAAERISRTGYTGPDLSVPVAGVDRSIEVKCRGSGFNQLYQWIENADFLIIKADRKKPLVITRLDLAAEIAVAAERGK